VSAFADFDPDDGALLKLIAGTWSDKLRELFDVTVPEANRVYQRLREIAETYPNPHSHGGFPKKGAALWFHLDGVGAIPAGLSDIRSSPHFELFPVVGERFETICAERDAADRWLRGGVYRAGFEWIDAGSTRRRVRPRVSPTVPGVRSCASGGTGGSDHRRRGVREPRHQHGLVTKPTYWSGFERICELRGYCTPRK
jgi:hypothetical protein